MDRFWSKVKRGGPDECWEWVAVRNYRGYGQFHVAMVDGRSRGNGAHRVAWELTHGLVPSGMSVLHRCDNPPCCNPAHLFVGTQADNVRDMERKGRRVSRTTPMHGERNGASKLTREQAAAILRSTESGSKVAAAFGVSRSLVSLIRRRKKWTKELACISA